MPKKACLRKAQNQLEKHQMGFDGEHIGESTLKKLGYKDITLTRHKHNFDLLTSRDAWEVKTVGVDAIHQMSVTAKQKIKKLAWAKKNGKRAKSMLIVVDGEANIYVKSGIGKFRPKGMKKVATYKNWRKQVGHGRTERLVEKRVVPEIGVGREKISKIIPVASPPWMKSVEKRHRIAIKKWAKLRDMNPDKYTKLIDERIGQLVDKSDVYIRIPPKNFQSVLKDGRFKSQFETKQSRGFLSNGFRRNHEKKVMGYSGKLPDNKRPIYGYLSDDIKGPKGGLGQYGSVRVRLKKGVRSRTTFTVGDSIDDTRQFAAFSPTPLSNPSHLAAGLQSDVTLESFKGGWSTDPLMYKTLNKSRTVDFWEAQLHGGVRVEDIEKVFFGKAPDSITKEFLKKAKIKWSVI